MLFLTIRHMTSHRKQTFLVLLGIVLGISAYVIFTGVMFGFREYIIDQLVNNNFHIRISARETYLSKHELDEDFFGSSVLVHWLKPPSGRRDSARIEYPPGWYQKLSNDKRIIAYSPQLKIQTLARNGKSTENINLIGCYSQDQMRVTTINNYMVEGKFKNISRGGNRLIIGSKLLKRLGARMDENILVSAVNGKATPFKIVGVFELGVQEIDESTAYALLGDVQKVNRTPGLISDIAVRLKDVTQARAVAARWNRVSSDQVLSWDQANTGILSVFRIQDFIRNFISFCILLVAGFGIYNILNILISQKRFEIAILRAMGYNRFDIVRLFMFQGFILGFLGGAIGLLFGYLGCRYLQTIPFGGTRYGRSEHLMISYNSIIYINAFLLAVGVSFLSSVLPAWHAGKLAPIEILRAEVRE